MLVMGVVNAQTEVIDTCEGGNITVVDDRLLILEAAEAKVNKTRGTTDKVEREYGPRAAQGFRLMLMSTSDRTLAMNTRAKLLQRFPEQKVYMAFLAPNIRLKFGNFVTKADADRYKKLIRQAGIVATNMYVIPEVVEVKPSKEDKSDDGKSDKDAKSTKKKG